MDAARSLAAALDEIDRAGQAPRNERLALRCNTLVTLALGPLPGRQTKVELHPAPTVAGDERR